MEAKKEGVLLEVGFSFICLCLFLMRKEIKIIMTELRRALLGLCRYKKKRKKWQQQ